MKLGTQIRLPDGREGTVVYNSLIGVGIKWGLHDPDPEDSVLWWTSFKMEICPSW